MSRRIGKENVKTQQETGAECCEASQSAADGRGKPQRQTASLEPPMSPRRAHCAPTAPCVTCACSAARPGGLTAAMICDAAEDRSGREELQGRDLLMFLIF